MALYRLLEHNAMSQHARFERFAASMLYAIAAGVKIDTDKTEPFSHMVNDLYKNPFEEKQKKQPTTAAEIKAHVLGKIRELRGRTNGSAEPCGKNNA